MDVHRLTYLENVRLYVKTVVHDNVILPDRLQDKQEQDIPPNYLKIEFAERIRAGPITYKLQVKIYMK